MQMLNKLKTKTQFNVTTRKKQAFLKTLENVLITSNVRNRALINKINNLMAFQRLTSPSGYCWLGPTA